MSKEKKANLSDEEKKIIPQYTEEKKEAKIEEQDAALFPSCGGFIE
jgi:hypothetical protein